MPAYAGREAAGFPVRTRILLHVLLLVGVHGILRIRDYEYRVVAVHPPVIHVRTDTQRIVTHIILL